tara:strand:- start:104 stop:262 length:159 start_codon:yes stop_codon:yes gene_type:complete
MITSNLNTLLTYTSISDEKKHAPVAVAFVLVIVQIVKSVHLVKTINPLNKII